MTEEAQEQGEQKYKIDGLSEMAQARLDNFAQLRETGFPILDTIATQIQEAGKQITPRNSYRRFENS